jgi:mono/diheme cytochrome c family protein
MKTTIVFILTLVSVTSAYSQGAQEQNIRAGQKLFVRHCSECHGQDGEGTERAPSIQRYVRKSEPALLQSFIRNGNLRKGMPSWSRLPDQQLNQLVTYLRAVQARATPSR